MRFEQIATAAAIAAIVCSQAFAGQTVKKFPHRAHVKAEIACQSCHEGVKSQGSLQDISIDVECSSCHSDGRSLKNKKPWEPTSALTFSHKNHMDRTGGDCSTCHSGITKEKLPAHKECLACHQKDYDDLNCKKCHGALGSMNLVPRSKFSHATNWLARHKIIASKDRSLCMQCHEDSYCSNCHNTRDNMRPSEKFPQDVERSFIHRADFRTRHAIEARANSASCLRCHNERNCLDCHMQEGVNTGAANYPHPAGWMSAGSAKFHGRVARQDIALCASCHESGAATNCIVCHGAGSGNNPHPPGWSTNLSKSAAACRRCH